MANTPHSAIITVTGNTGDTIHTATAISSKPKTCLTWFIHAPARGSRLPAEIPVSSSGTLMPAAIENSAQPPVQTLRVWLIYSSAPASGPATHGPTDQAGVGAITDSPIERPAARLAPGLLKRLCRALGSCNW